MQKEQQKKILYILMLAGIVWMYASYIPFLMDYYVMRPEESFSEFFQRYVVDDVYDYETVLLALVLAALCLVFQNAGAGVGVLSLILFVLSHASYTKYINRKELLRLDDLRLTEAAGMASNYLDFNFDKYLGLWVGGLLVFVAATVVLEVMRCKWKKEELPGGQKNKKKIVRAFAGLAAAVALMGIVVLYSEQFFLEQSNANAVDDAGLVREKGNQYVLYCFVKNDNLKTITAENVGESYDFFLEKEAARDAEGCDSPNVIVIMNESWWNTDNLDTSKISFSLDPMAPYKELPDTCIKGYLTSNVYGGGTVSSEADFLTGINTKYCAGDTLVFVHTMDRKLPSLVDYFKSLDYETIAMHPYYGWFYSRDAVYEKLEFDKVIFEEDMEYRDIYTQYISDESLAKQIIKEYESSEDNKFIWAVSVANHKTVLEYEVDKVANYDFPISVKLAEDTLGTEDRETLVSYVNGIYNSGKAYEMLIEYFADKEEPVVVVMFGDHIPNFSKETLEAVGLDMESESPEMLRKMYSVPVAIWSNYETEGITVPEGESICYLPEMLIEYANLPDSDMTRILRCQKNMLKTNVRSFMTDVDGNVIEHCTEEQLQLINHSKSVAYDLMYGESVGQNVWIPIKSN